MAAEAARTSEQASASAPLLVATWLLVGLGVVLLAVRTPALDEASAATGKNIIPVVAERAEIARLMNRHLGVGSETIEGLMAAKGEEEVELLERSPVGVIFRRRVGPGNQHRLQPRLGELERVADVVVRSTDLRSVLPYLGFDVSPTSGRRSGDRVGDSPPRPRKPSEIRPKSDGLISVPTQLRRKLVAM